MRQVSTCFFDQSSTRKKYKSNEEMHGAFTALLNGMATRGTGGVLYVKGESCAYCFPQEFPDAGFREVLANVLEEWGDRCFFVVEERDGNVHILRHDKEEVYRAAREALSDK